MAGGTHILKRPTPASSGLTPSRFYCEILDFDLVWFEILSCSAPLLAPLVPHRTITASSEHGLGHGGGLTSIIGLALQ